MHFGLEDVYVSFLLYIIDLKQTCTHNKDFFKCQNENALIFKRVS